MIASTKTIILPFRRHSVSNNQAFLQSRALWKKSQWVATFFRDFPRPLLLPVEPFSSSALGKEGETEMSGAASSASHHPAKAWQAKHNLEIQRVTQKALIHELTQQQTKTIETVVPWFLQNMPFPYFRQVPERVRMDHIKAIAAVKEANMELYLNLKSHTSDGRTVLTYIRQGTRPGLLLDMLVKDLPFSVTRSEEYVPLTRVQVFSAKDSSMSLNIFVYGDEATEENDDHLEHKLGAQIFAYAEAIQKGDVTTPTNMESQFPGGEEEQQKKQDASFASSSFVRQDALVPGVAKSLSSLAVFDDGRHQPRPSPLFERESLIEYLKRCSKSYIERTDPRRFLRQRELFEKVSGTEGTAMWVEEDGPSRFWINVAVANSLPQVALENVARLLFVHKFDVIGAHVDTISDRDNGSVIMLRMHVALVPGTIVDDETFRLLGRELKRTKWIDPQTVSLVFDRHPWLGVQRGEIITAFCALMHPVMAKQNAFVYSKANIFNTIAQERYVTHAADIADLFLDRFNPLSPLSNRDFGSRCSKIRVAIGNDVEDTTASEMLLKMIDIVRNTLKTNLYLEDRFSLGLRLNSKVMVSEGENRELPYGILFAHGRRFNAYHVRFRDISRGGMRLVTPPNAEQYALESARHYDECYGLAFAQQLKNKDIPEGGSKAVNLIDMTGISSKAARNFVMRKCVKAFTDTILDLVVDTQETLGIVDLYGRKEVLYLGPDEQVTPEDINWIVERAAKRGYDTPAAFMSSKPRAGINHKEYGVTSEGVNVYLDVALRHLGIDPKKDCFTVKLTGGPDGDVAGNELKILMREYGDNVKIVGVADQSGCAQDPEGLCHEELYRLIQCGSPIAQFDLAKLSPDGDLHTVDTEEGVKARNSMHNRLQADAFLPCGGRPNSIDIQNYKQFLNPDGTPSSPLIVEGANLFVTSEARQALFDDAGVLIVKDSSANKCGVITSSYEICAAMMLDEEEFFEHKDAIVDEVIAKLRGLAKMEAELLFREFESYGGSLPHVSQVISNTINVATDALTVALDSLSIQDCEELLPLFRAHLPKTLADLAFKHVHQRVPVQYIKNAIASCLASKMVYKEGTKFVEVQPRQKLAEVALKYVEKEKEVALLRESLAAANMPEDKKKTISKLLDAGGARTALSVL